jgi:hypothetical protein
VAQAFLDNLRMHTFCEDKRGPGVPHVVEANARHLGAANRRLEGARHHVALPKRAALGVAEDDSTTT